ncbi:MAG TPA: hypothetical protein VKU60_03965 [Chloroflexota bacterium]|nr:hypothetical protein [Chloroflexota bacterium]
MFDVPQLLFVLMLLLTLALTAPRYGVDSRHGFGPDELLDDQPGRRRWFVQ